MTSPAVAALPGIPASGLLAAANAALRAGAFAEATRLYGELLIEAPALAAHAAWHVRHAAGRWRQGADAGTVLLAAVDGGWRASGRLAVLAGLYTGQPVRLLQLHQHASEPQPALAEASGLAESSARIPAAGDILPALLRLACAHPCDTLHLHRATPAGLLLGALCALLWDARVVVDVAANDLADADPLREALPAALQEQALALARDGTWDVAHWQGIAARLAAAFGPCTVADAATQARLPGAVVAPRPDASTAGADAPDRQSVPADPALLTRLLSAAAGPRGGALQAWAAAAWQPQQPPATTPPAADSVDVVVPVFNALEDVRACLESVQACTDGLAVRCIVVDDGSDAETASWLRAFCAAQPGFELIAHATNLGYTRAINAGLRASRAPFVVTLNSDTVVTPGWLPGLLRCLRASPGVGLAGPLSNAASWQNVPELYDAHGRFAVNALPPGMDPAGMAAAVAEVAQRSYPRTPFLNGFCIMLRREVLDAVGLMDEAAFPVGYGEENDLCIRAADAGFALAIADDVYVHHAKSRSFGHDRRRELSRQGNETLRRKHGDARFDRLLARVRDTRAMDEVRRRVRDRLFGPTPPADLATLRLLYLVPVKGNGGGVHSVVQEVAELRRLGIAAHVGIRAEHLAIYLQNYADIAGAQDLFVTFEPDTLLDIAVDYDVVVGTIFTSMRLVRRIAEAYPHVLPAYYVQDYEPLFFAEGSAQWQEAHDSYAMVRGALVFAKTQWLVRTVEEAHGVRVHKVSPSIDHALYHPAPRQPDGRIHLVAMIRPHTPRRGAHRTMRLLSRLSQTMPGALAIHLFGCDAASEEFATLRQDFPAIHHGVLRRPEVAALLAGCDLFLDLSDYQAFGRTALEAMACGCAAVVPAAGGALEYAVDGCNALVVDTRDEEACFQAVQSLLGTPGRLLALRQAGLLTASTYSVTRAALSECLPIAAALAEHRRRHPRPQARRIALVAAVGEDREFSFDGYSRMLLPYKAGLPRARWRIQPVRDGLPAPGSADIAVLQCSGLPPRDAGSWQAWLHDWKAAGGALVYDVDGGSLWSSRQMPDAGAADWHDALLSTADLVIAPTEEAATALRRQAARVQVLPDALDDESWQLAGRRETPATALAPRTEGVLRIGYAAADIEETARPFGQWLAELKDRLGDRLEVEVIDPFYTRPSLFGQRIGLPRKADYPSYVRWLAQRAQWDLALVVPRAGQERTLQQQLQLYAGLGVPVFCVGAAPPDAAPRPARTGSRDDLAALLADMLADPASPTRPAAPTADERRRLAASTVAARLHGWLAALLER